MKKLIKTATKILSLILSVLMIVTVLPMQVFATEVIDTDPFANFTAKENAPAIQNEIVDKRTPYSKVFATEDGGYYTIVSTTPIHIEDENGVLQDIAEAPTDLTSEESISNFVTQEAQSFNANPSIATYSMSPGEGDTEHDNAPFSIKCISANNGATISDGYYVQGTRSGNKFVLVRPSLEQFDNNSNVIITSAKLLANGLGNGSSDQNYVVAREVLSQWSNEDTTIPTLNSYFFDAVPVAKTDGIVPIECEWDITELMNSWLLGKKENYGFALNTNVSNRKCDVELKNIQLSYYSYEISELDKSLSYESIEMGIAGTLYINHYTKTPILVHSDLGISGEKAPVEITQVYNPFNNNMDKMTGKHIRFNYFSTLQFSDGVYTWNTVDGDKINFYCTDATNTSKLYSGKGSDSTIYQLELKRESLNNQFLYTKFENITITRAEEGEEYTYCFETHGYTGYLTKIVDPSTNKNTITINYDIDDGSGTYKSNYIQYISDGVGRKYNFEYEEIANDLYVSEIYVTNASGQPITVGSADQSAPYKTLYTYETRDNQVYLTKVDHVGTTRDAQFSYDEQNRLSTISNGKETLILTYESDTGNKLSSYKKTQTIGAAETVLEDVTIDDSLVYQRVFTNINDEEKVINFDNRYNMTYYNDYTGVEFFGANNGDEEVVLTKEDDKNLIQNGDFELLSLDGSPENWDCTDVESKTSNLLGCGTSFGIVGEWDYACRVMQQVSAPEGTVFAKGENFAYGGQGRADNVLVANDYHSFGIYIFDAKTENNQIVPNQCISYFNFDGPIAAKDWQQKMSTFTLQQDTPALFVYLCLDYNLNGQPAYFDNVVLYPQGIPSGDNEKLYEYNNNDSISSWKILSKNDASSYLESVYSYDESCNLNYLASEEDQRGITTYYQYDPNNGQLLSLANGIESNKKYFEYTAAGLLSSVKQNVTNIITGQTVEIKTNYGYTDDMLTSITHNGFSYNLSYDAYGNVTSIGISTDNTPLETRTYTDASKLQLDTVTYANGCTIDYSYDVDEPDKITQIDYKNADGTLAQSYQYTYDENGMLSSITDNQSNVKMLYNGDEYSYILLNGETEVVLYHSYVDDNGNTVEEFPQANDYATTVMSTPSNIVENEQHETIQSSLQILTREGIINDGTIPVRYSYEKESVTDTFGRLKTNKLSATYQAGEDTVVVNSTDEYSYKAVGNRQLDLITTYRTAKSLGLQDANGALIDENGNTISTPITDLTFNYTYDAAGNITKVMLTDNATGGTILYGAYQYDEAGQLVFEYSPTKDCCIKYTYDAGGNITLKRVYSADAYDPENNDTYSEAPYNDITYTYDTNYRDKLIAFDGVAIQYDSLNNPINYAPANGFFEWSGRLLTAFETNGEGERYEYTYDADGYRIKKDVYEKSLVPGTTDEYSYSLNMSYGYIWDNGVLKGFSFTNPEENISSYVNIIYDETGMPQGYIGFTGTPYYFVRDGLGNIIQVIGGSDDVTVNISYDAWGNPQFPENIDNFGTAIVTAFICAYNPCSFKGYLYDYETGLYYCQSRYYSPVWSRFLNMDNTAIMRLTQGEILGANLFAYCNNNPINYTDADGCWAQNYSGFKWTNKGFNLYVSKAFLSKTFCLTYAADILRLKRTLIYKHMTQKRMAVELYFHAVVYYSTSLLKRLGVNQKTINSWNTSARYMEINYDDNRVAFFYLAWQIL